MTPQALIPAVVIPLVGYRLYRRFRSHVGPQPVRRTRLAMRVGVFALLGAGFLALAVASGQVALAVGGLALGAAIGVAGLRFTQFDPGGREYTPDARIGAAVTALLVARLAWRFALAPPVVQGATAGDGSPPDPVALLQQTPLTTAVLMVVVGYYVVYFTGVLVESRRMAAAGAVP